MPIDGLFDVGNEEVTVVDESVCGVDETVGVCAVSDGESVLAVVPVSVVSDEVTPASAEEKKAAYPEEYSLPAKGFLQAQSDTSKAAVKITEITLFIFSLLIVAGSTSVSLTRGNGYIGGQPPFILKITAVIGIRNIGFAMLGQRVKHAFFKSAVKQGIQ